MRRLLLFGMLMASTWWTISTGVVEAQNRFQRHNCCRICTRPVDLCCCPTLKPVVETCYRTEREVNYRTEKRTAYRQQLATETVPVTTYKQVTVDEGGYQKIWVPKLVIKTVPQAVHQTRLICKTVPYKVSYRVQDVTTRLVPYQRVRYVRGCASPVCPTLGRVSSGFPLSLGGVPYTSSTQKIVTGPVPDSRHIELPRQSAIQGNSSNRLPSVGSATANNANTFPTAPSAATVFRSGFARR